MEDMKLPTDKLVSQQWGIPTAQLIQREDNGDATTHLVINKHIRMQNMEKKKDRDSSGKWKDKSDKYNTQ